MAKAGINLKKDVQHLERVAGRAGADTIRLWESYREQAFLWRALALLQMPATALSIAAALVMYFFADTIIEVPEKPSPGFYSVKQLPDNQFISAATEVVNLIATFQPQTARAQFSSARKFLWQPALGAFEDEMMTKELRAIEETGRSQLFFVNSPLVKLERHPEADYAIARLPGTRMKVIGEKPMKPDQIVYFVRMTTIPRNMQNDYGIVVTDIRLEKTDFKTVYWEDKTEARREARQGGGGQK